MGNERGGMNSSLTQVLSKTIDIRKSRKETISKVLHAAHSVRTERQKATLNLLSTLQESNFIATIRQRKADLAGERDRFSIFDLIKDNYNELFHSATIAWLLDYKSNHDLGNVPMRLFVQLLNSAFGKECIPEHSFDHATVERETHGRIDILITTQTECIIIENKIRNAPDQLEQLKRYYNSMKATHTVKAIVYLTPDGHSPGEYSVGDEKDSIKPLLINLPSYSPHNPNLSTGVVDAILSSCYIDNLDILSLVRQYGLFLRKIRGDYMIDLTIEDFVKSITTKDGVIDKDLFDTAYYIKRELNWVAGINEKTYNDLQNRIADHPSLKAKFSTTTCLGKNNYDLVHFNFKTKNGDHFGIDLRETDWGARRVIQLFYRQENDTQMESEDNFEAVKNIISPIADKAGYRLETKEFILYCGGVAGIPYVGNEDVFYKLVIDILDALA